MLAEIKTLPEPHLPVQSTNDAVERVWCGFTSSWVWRFLHRRTERSPVTRPLRRRASSESPSRVLPSWLPSPVPSPLTVLPDSGARIVDLHVLESPRHMSAVWA